MRHGVSVALLATVLLASACGDDEPPEPTRAGLPTPSAAPSYDATLEPAAAVLALVPEDARTLTVTDFDQVRKELGLDGVTGASTAEEVAAFWQRAETERPLLTAGLLRPADRRSPEDHGVTELDVAWEAHFFAGDDHETGWVLRFRDGTDMTRVAAAAEDPASPLHGGTVDDAELLVSSGAAGDPALSWAADPATRDLVGLPANSTYLSRECDPAATGDDLDELAVWSIQFEGSLATARLGPDRQDLFARMRLGDDEPAFTAAFDGGAADPLTGRIGYVMTDPVAAVELAIEHALPFAACP